MSKSHVVPPPVVTSAAYLAASKTGDLPAPIGVEIAFAGRSNVGKSSLMNALMGRKGLVRTSSTPGCTREVTLFEVVLKSGLRLTFTDLPGFGFAKRSKDEIRGWGRMIDQYLLTRSTLVGVVLLVDIRRGVQQAELDLLEMVGGASRVSRAPLAAITVATKLDKMPKTEHADAIRKIAAQTKTPVVGFSSKDPDARGPVWAALLGATGLAQGTEPELVQSTAPELAQGTAPEASLPRSSRSQSP